MFRRAADITCLSHQTCVSVSFGRGSKSLQIQLQLPDNPVELEQSGFFESLQDLF